MRTTPLILLATTAATTTTALQPRQTDPTTTASPEVYTPPDIIINAVPGSLQLGATCSDDAQCAHDAQCWGTTAMTIRSCGSFNAACASDAQCATNTCEDMLCKGFLEPEDYLSNQTPDDAGEVQPVPLPSPVDVEYPAGNATVTAEPSGTGNVRPTAEPMPYDGAAGRSGVAVGLTGMVAAAVALLW
ncbi:hypothetical protein MBLNU230_g6103t1 [Neophaeotheca triangularis]